MRVDGLAGSATAATIAQLPRHEHPYLVIVNDLDEAGYLYNDLCHLADDRQALFFPSGYKRDIKYGQIDAPNDILRTEVLGRWHSDDRLRWVVTYPEALAERVATRQVVSHSTVELAVGQHVDLIDIAARLRELGFVEVDYVYEPGQMALRGSLLDVFSYSNELPCRIDFFGDEVDSIRLFNIETQLSERRLDSVSLLPNAGSRSRDNDSVSLLDYAGADTMVVCRDVQWVIDRVRAIGDEDFSSSALLAGEGDSSALDNVVDVEAFARAISAMRRIEVVNGPQPSCADAALTLHCEPQSIFHKNFDLISSSFRQLQTDGYRLLVLSDNAKQLQRLRDIFADRGDDITFDPVLTTLHEGFVDHDLHLCQKMN